MRHTSTHIGKHWHTALHSGTQQHTAAHSGKQWHTVAQSGTKGQTAAHSGLHQHTAAHIDKQQQRAAKSGKERQTPANSGKQRLTPANTDKHQQTPANSSKHQEQVGKQWHTAAHSPTQGYIRVFHSPIFVSNIFSKYLIWLPGPQGLQKHKNLCCQTCIKVPTEPMSISHYSDITALRGQLLTLQHTILH